VADSGESQDYLPETLEEYITIASPEIVPPPKAVCRSEVGQPTLECFNGNVICVIDSRDRHTDRGKQHFEPSPRVKSICGKPQPVEVREQTSIAKRIQEARSESNLSHDLFGEYRWDETVKFLRKEKRMHAELMLVLAQNLYDSLVHPPWLGGWTSIVRFCFPEANMAKGV